jgi:hypothetical protein
MDGSDSIAHRASARARKGTNVPPARSSSPHDRNPGRHATSGACRAGQATHIATPRLTNTRPSQRVQRQRRGSLVAPPIPISGPATREHRGNTLGQRVTERCRSNPSGQGTENSFLTSIDWRWDSISNRACISIYGALVQEHCVQ